MGGLTVSITGTLSGIVLGELSAQRHHTNPIRNCVSIPRPHYRWELADVLVDLAIRSLSTARALGLGGV